MLMDQALKKWYKYNNGYNTYWGKITIVHQKCIVLVLTLLYLHKAVGVPKFSIGIDNFLIRFKSITTSGAKHVIKRHCRYSETKYNYLI